MAEPNNERLARVEEQYKSCERDLSALKKNVVYKDVFERFSNEHSEVAAQVREINRSRHRFAGAVLLLAFLISSVMPLAIKWWAS